MLRFLLVMIAFQVLTESILVNLSSGYYEEILPVNLDLSCLCIMEAWLSVHDVATVQNMYPKNNTDRNCE